MARGFRLGGDVEFTALKAEMARKSDRSRMRGDDNLHRICTATGAVVDTDQCAKADAVKTEQGARRRASDGVRIPAADEASSAPLRSGPSALPPSPGIGLAVPAAPDPFVVLPWPTTGNHTVKHANGGHYLTADARDYRTRVAQRCVRLRGIVTGQYRLNVHFSPPDARPRDMDNALKGLLDALVLAKVLPSDSMTFMRELRVTVDDFRRNNVGVHVEPIDPKEAA